MSIATVISEGFVSGSISAIIKDGFASYTGLPEPPASGYQYKTVGSLSYTGYSMEFGSSPAVALGDIFILQDVTTPNSFVVEPNNNGTVEILASGSTSRQSFIYDIYRLASNTVDGPATIWVNEIGPHWANPLSVGNMISGLPISPINLASSTYAYSPEGDTLTFALVSGSLPLGLTLASNGIISGTPTVVALYTFVISATDSTGTTTNSGTNSINVISSSTGGVVPNTLGFTLTAAVNAYQTAGYTALLFQFVNSVTVPNGSVAGQSPAAGTSSAGSTTQTIYLSMGPSTIQETNL
jgi:hypothetical protein